MIAHMGSKMHIHRGYIGTDYESHVSEMSDRTSLYSDALKYRYDKTFSCKIGSSLSPLILGKR